MGYTLYREVLHFAPETLDTGQLALLLVLADLANENTRRCVPGMEELQRLMRMSGDGVMRILKRLEAAGINVRVPVGTDKLGRPVYAHKGIRTTYEIPVFDTAGKPGPQSALTGEARTSVLPFRESPDQGPASGALSPDHSPTYLPQSPDQRPAIAPESSDQRPAIAPESSDRSPGLTPQSPGHGPAKEPRSPDAGPGNAAKPGPASGPSSSREEERSSLSSIQRILQAAGCDLTDEEETSLAAYVRDTFGGLKGPGWWRTIAANGDLTGVIDAWRAQTRPQAGRPATRLCAACGQRFTPERGQPDPCCEPCRNGAPTP